MACIFNRECLSERRIDSHASSGKLLAGLVDGDLINREQQYSHKGQEIAGKLDVVEVLYVLASKPAIVLDLNGRLKAAFGLEMDFSRVGEVVEILDSRRLIRKFSNYSNESQSIPQEALTITALGLSKLGEWIESLSEIALTMQLGLDQRIVVSRE